MPNAANNFVPAFWAPPQIAGIELVRPPILFADIGRHQDEKIDAIAFRPVENLAAKANGFHGGSPWYAPGSGWTSRAGRASASSVAWLRLRFTWDADSKTDSR